MNRVELRTTLVWRIMLRIYAVYSGITFLMITIALFPLFFLSYLFNWHNAALVGNQIWSRIFFFFAGIKMEVIYKERLNKSNNYIFCPNHFSFLDIAVVPYVNVPFKFVGKLSIAKVPLLGFVFKQFHITVDRSKLRDRYATYTKSLSALTNGYSLTIFPEGGINSPMPPTMGRFKDGPFRMAIETGTPLVPVTLPDNWHIFPDDGRFYLNRRKCRMVVHEPIDPRNYSMDTIKEFQEHVRTLIQAELNVLNITA